MPRLDVKVPQGTPPGATILVQDHNGKSISVMIPRNNRPGDVISVEYEENIPYQPPITTQVYSPFPQPSAQLMAQQSPSNPTLVVPAAPIQSSQTQYPYQANLVAQPVIIQPGVTPLTGSEPVTLVHDGHGAYMEGYNVTTTPKFGVKSALVCVVLVFVCLPAACFVPCFPCDEEVIGQTADGKVFRIER